MKLTTQKRLCAIVWSTLISEVVAILLWLALFEVFSYKPSIWEMSRLLGVELPHTRLFMPGWWDLLIAPAWSTVLVLLFTGRNVDVYKTELWNGLISGIVATAITAIMVGITGFVLCYPTAVLTVGISSITVISAVVGGVATLRNTAYSRPVEFGLTTGAIMGLSTGLLIALVAGMFAGIAISALVTVSAFMGALLSSTADSLFFYLEKISE